MPEMGFPQKRKETDIFTKTKIKLMELQKWMILSIYKHMLKPQEL